MLSSGAIKKGKDEKGVTKLHQDAFRRANRFADLNATRWSTRSMDATYSALARGYLAALLLVLFVQVGIAQQPAVASAVPTNAEAASKPQVDSTSPGKALANVVDS